MKVKHLALILLVIVSATNIGIYVNSEHFRIMYEYDLKTAGDSAHGGFVVFNIVVISILSIFFFAFNWETPLRRVL